MNGFGKNRRRQLAALLILACVLLCQPAQAQEGGVRTKMGRPVPGESAEEDVSHYCLRMGEMILSMDVHLERAEEAASGKAPAEGWDAGEALPEVESLVNALSEPGNTGAEGCEEVRRRTLRYLRNLANLLRAVERGTDTETTKRFLSAARSSREACRLAFGITPEEVEAAGWEPDPRGLSLFGEEVFRLQTLTTADLDNAFAASPCLEGLTLTGKDDGWALSIWNEAGTVLPGCVYRRIMAEVWVYRYLEVPRDELTPELWDYVAPEADLDRMFVLFAGDLKGRPIDRILDTLTSLESVDASWEEDGTVCVLSFADAGAVCGELSLTPRGLASLVGILLEYRAEVSVGEEGARIRYDTEAFR